MSILRQLASQTVIYGLSSILGRFLNYLLVPLYTYTFNASEYGVVSEFYAYAGFLAVLLVCGMETGYFRYRQNAAFSADTVYNNCLSVLLIGNLLFIAAVSFGRHALAVWLDYPAHPEYLVWFAGILGLDAITALPFARLRAENRAWRFALIRLAEIFITIGLNIFFLILWPKINELWPESWLSTYYEPAIGVGYIFIANLLASICKLLLLLPQFKAVPVQINLPLLKTISRYSLPMVVIGFAGMINEMLDRAILKIMLPYDLQTNLKMLGIYGACYKLSILMSLFVQAFRYAGEPFFFAYAGRSDAPKTYALVMRYFVIAGVFIFLLVMLYLDFFKYFIGEAFREGLQVVPILLLANLFLGIYVNLSIWYKLSDKTMTGAWVSLAGAGLTIVLNIWWIPDWGYMGSAWATLICYLFMVIFSWYLGQRHYPIPYPVTVICAYLLAGIFLYLGNHYVVSSFNLNNGLISTGTLMLYSMAVVMFEIRPLLKTQRRQ